MKKVIITGASAIGLSTLHRLKQEVPSDMDVIVLDEHQMCNPEYYLIDTEDLIGVREPKPVTKERKKKRKDFWNELPKPKRGRR